MDPLFILVPIVLAIPALYLLLTRPTKRLGGNLRPDNEERPELTGTEQRKRRPYKSDL